MNETGRADMFEVLSKYSTVRLDDLAWSENTSPDGGRLTRVLVKINLIVMMVNIKFIKHK